MNLLEAIQQCGDNWFRPKKDSWNGQAIAVENGCTILVPDDLGEDRWFMICSVENLLEDYEIITPEQVMAELE